MPRRLRRCLPGAPRDLGPGPRQAAPGRAARARTSAGPAAGSLRSRTKDGLRRTVMELDDETDALVYGAVRGASCPRCATPTSKAKVPPDRQRTTQQNLADAIREVAHRSPGRRRHHQAQGPPRHPGHHRDVRPVGPAAGQRRLRARRRHQAHRRPAPQAGLRGGHHPDGPGRRRCAPRHGPRRPPGHLQAAPRPPRPAPHLRGRGLRHGRSTAARSTTSSPGSAAA